MSLFFTALSVLTSLTGVATSNTLDTTVVDLSNICSLVGEAYSINAVDEITNEVIEITNATYSLLNNEDYEDIDLTKLDLSCFSSVDLIYYNDIYDLKGLNRYIEVGFNDKYVIYDKYDFEIEEVSLKDNNPYKGYDNCFKVYSDGEYGFNYLVFDGEVFIDTETFLEVDFSDAYSDFQESDIEAGYYVAYEEYSNPNTVSIPNAVYFQKLRGGYGANYTGVCGIVSTQNVFQYMNFFFNDNIIDEEYEYAVACASTRISDFLCSPCTGDMTTDNEDNEYLDYLVDKCEELTGTSPIDGMGPEHLVQFIDAFFEDLNLNVTLNYCTGNLSDVFSDYTKTIMRNGINAGRPVIANGCEHSMVAYAYCTDYVYIETGLNDYAMKTTWDTFNSNVFGFRSSAVDIVYNDVHVCSDDYIHSTTTDRMCPCEMTI